MTALGGPLLAVSHQVSISSDGLWELLGWTRQAGGSLGLRIIFPPPSPLPFKRLVHTIRRLLRYFIWGPVAPTGFPSNSFDSQVHFKIESAEE